MNSYRGLVLALAASMLATGAAAQVGGRPGGVGAAGGVDTSHVPRPRTPNGPEASGPTSLLASVQYRLELLEEDLRLLPEQKTAWLNYRDRVLKLAEDAQRGARTALAGEMTAPQRLDKLADIARDRLTAIEDIVDAGKQLYAVLVPGQRSVADRRMAVPLSGLAGVEPGGQGGQGGPGGRSGPPGNP